MAADTSASMIDPVTAALMQANTANAVGQATQGMTYLMETARLGYQGAINMREAAAVQEMRMSAQSREVLQTQAALNAPRQTAPAYEAVAVKTP